jgi:site-specific recombinase XerD
MDFLKLVNLDMESANTILTSHLDKFVGYLDSKGLKKSYQNKIIGCVKGMYNWACSNGVLQNNPVQYFKNVRPSKPVKVYLNEAQIKQVENYQFSSPHIQKAADLFIFQFHTGLAYADTQAFNLIEHCKIINGVSWIILARQKSGTEARVPMSSTVLDLIAKYGGEAPKLVIQRNKLNLKEIANIIGFDLKLTSHVGRKTALNNWLESGIKLETVSAMAGHSSTKVTQSHYTEVSISKMENDISPHFLALNVQPYRQQPLLP